VIQRRQQQQKQQLLSSSASRDMPFEKSIYAGVTGSTGNGPRPCSSSASMKCLPVSPYCLALFLLVLTTRIHYKIICFVSQTFLTNIQVSNLLAQKSAQYNLGGIVRLSGETEAGKSSFITAVMLGLGYDLCLEESSGHRTGTICGISLNSKFIIPIFLTMPPAKPTFAIDDYILYY